MQPAALTIAGSDPSGGAGLQADLKTFQAFDVYGMSVVTLLTVQNTVEVRSVEPVSPELVEGQLEAVTVDIPPQAAKTGALGTREIVEVVAEWAGKTGVPLVVDPVMVSTQGRHLLSGDARGVFVEQLLPRAVLVTPNLDEARELAGVPVETIEQMEIAARRIAGIRPKGSVGEGRTSARRTDRRALVGGPHRAIFGGAGCLASHPRHRLYLLGGDHGGMGQGQLDGRCGGVGEALRHARDCRGSGVGPRGRAAESRGGGGLSGAGEFWRCGARFLCCSWRGRAGPETCPTGDASQWGTVSRPARPQPRTNAGHRQASWFADFEGLVDGDVLQDLHLAAWPKQFDFSNALVVSQTEVDPSIRCSGITDRRRRLVVLHRARFRRQFDLGADAVVVAFLTDQAQKNPVPRGLGDVVENFRRLSDRRDDDVDSSVAV